MILSVFSRLSPNEIIKPKPVQDIVEGHIAPRWEYMNGFSEGEDTKGAVCARVHDIFPPQGNSGVSSGVIYIESGEFADEKALFDRKDCSSLQ